LKSGVEGRAAAMRARGAAVLLHGVLAAVQVGHRVARERLRGVEAVAHALVEVAEGHGLGLGAHPERAGLADRRADEGRRLPEGHEGGGVPRVVDPHGAREVELHPAHAELREPRGDHRERHVVAPHDGHRDQHRAAPPREVDQRRRDPREGPRGAVDRVVQRGHVAEERHLEEVHPRGHEPREHGVVGQGAPVGLHLDELVPHRAGGVGDRGGAGR
jgi:hypothetical protein